jgi:hypothetical protein
MCQPELSLDPKALNARLNRLEEQMKSGIKVVAQPAAEATAPQEEEEELPPPPGDEDAPPVQEDAPAAAPVGFWSDLVSALRNELPLSSRGFFAMGPNAPVEGRLKGDELILYCQSDFTMGMVSKPELLQVISQRAAALAGRPVRVRCVDRSQAPRHSDKMDQLLQFSRSHSDVIKIKE